MHIEHVAIWCRDLERMREFYQRYLAAEANDKYTNARGFCSYFLRFPPSDCRLELMQRADVVAGEDDITREWLGLAHIAFRVGSREAVDAMTTALQQAGCRCLSGPRVTGDGYYESCLFDPENNRIELCA